MNTNQTDKSPDANDEAGSVLEPALAGGEAVPAFAPGDPAAFIARLAPEEIKESAIEILNNLLRMLGFETQIESEIKEQNLRILIKCEDAGRLIGRGGNSLSGLQFLLNRLLFRKKLGAPRVLLDVEGFKEQMDQEVLRRADAAAEQVRRWGESLELAPMNSYERRVVHQRFANDPEIVVESVADARNKNLKKMVMRLRG